MWSVDTVKLDAVRHVAWRDGENRYHIKYVSSADKDAMHKNLSDMTTGAGQYFLLSTQQHADSSSKWCVFDCGCIVYMVWTWAVELADIEWKPCCFNISLWLISKRNSKSVNVWHFYHFIHALYIWFPEIVYMIYYYLQCCFWLSDYSVFPFAFTLVQSLIGSVVLFFVHWGGMLASMQCGSSVLVWFVCEASWTDVICRCFVILPRKQR